MDLNARARVCVIYDWLWITVDIASYSAVSSVQTPAQVDFRSASLVILWRWFGCGRSVGSFVCVCLGEGGAYCQSNSRVVSYAVYLRLFSICTA